MESDVATGRSEMFPLKWERLWSQVMTFIWQRGLLLAELTLMEASAVRTFSLTPPVRSS